MSQFSKDAFRLNPGDLVLIPSKFFPEIHTRAEYVPAEVRNVCTNHVVFLFKQGFTRSLPHANCKDVLLCRASDFKVYGREDAQKDLVDSLEGIHIAKENDIE